MNWLLVLLSVLCAVRARAQEEYLYTVRREKIGRDELGTLQIDQNRISYASSNGKTSIIVPLLDVHEMDLSNSSLIRVETYTELKKKLGGRQNYRFRLIDSQHDERLRRFLSSTLQRPVLASFGQASDGAFELSAYHRHRMGGCNGRILIDTSGVRFVSEDTKDSRTWLYRDIETIGSMNSFHFRISTLTETYNFDLKQRLPENVYQVAFSNVYALPK